MQVDAPLHNDQTEPRTRPITDVMRTVEGVEKPLSVGVWNSDPLVADSADYFRLLTPDFEPHRSASGRVLYGICQQIGENVAEQPLVGLNLARNCAHGQLNRTAPVGGRQHLFHQPGHEGPKI